MFEQDKQYFLQLNEDLKYCQVGQQRKIQLEMDRILIKYGASDSSIFF